MRQELTVTSPSITLPSPMSLRRRWWVGGVLAPIAAVLAATLWLYGAGCLAYSPIATIHVVLMATSSLLYSVVGGLIVFHRPANRIGWLALWCAAGMAISIAIWMYVPCAAAAPSVPPAAPYIAWFYYTFDSIVGMVAQFVLIPMLFPTGRFLSSAWARVTAAGVFLLICARLGMAFLPDFRRDNAFETQFDLANPLGLASLPEWWYPLFRYSSLVIVCVLCLLGIAAFVVRFRRSAGEERQQMKWLAYFLVTAVATQILVFELPGGTVYPEIFSTIWYDAILLVVFGGFPVIVGLTVFKYRLYDIDLIISRTVIYAALTAVLVALYVALVAGLGALFHDTNNVAASLVATGVIAVVFHPVRARVQDLANRSLFGERDDPAGVLTRLAGQLESADSSASLLSSLVETTAVSLKLPYVALYLHTAGEEDRLAAATGVRPAQVQTMPLLHQRETIGYLMVAPRTPGEALSAADQSLLASITRLTATSVRTVQLSHEVQDARVRIVTAREEERRRLRRDLHDGLGPVLASQGLKLAAARQLLRREPEAAERLLDDVMSRSESTVAEVRRLVYALRPPTLDEFGLAEAIREHVDMVRSVSNLRIALEAPPRLPEIPAAIEAAAFRIVQEALNNVIRHAQAQQCRIEIGVADGDLQIAVRDDGVGMPPDTRRGVGLVSMFERSAEVGGVCRIERADPHGAVVRLALPLAHNGG